jgi:hypothetical protein
MLFIYAEDAAEVLREVEYGLIFLCILKEIKKES